MKMTKKSLLGVVAMTAVMFGATEHADADSVVAVVADVNARVHSSTNTSFYDAILDDNTNVLFSRHDEQQGDLNAYYANKTGVSTFENSAALTAGILAPVDLLVVTRYFNRAINYSAAEMTAISDFVSGGGDLLVILEARAQSNLLNGYNDLLTSVGSSIQYTGTRFAVVTPPFNAENTSLGALDPFRVSAYNTLSGGTSVYNDAAGNSVVAFQALGDPSQIVPSPTAAMAGVFALGGLALRRRRSA